MRRGGRHAAILEDHLTRVAGAHAQFVFLLARLQPGCPARHDECGNAAAALIPIGDRHHDHRLAKRAVRDELLRSRQHPRVPVATSRGSHRRGIASRTGLGKRPGAPLLPFGKRPQVLRFLLVVPKVGKVRSGESVVRRDGERDRWIDSCKLFDADAVRHGGLTGAAQGLRHLDAHQPDRGQLRTKVGGEGLRFVPSHDVRTDFRLGEFANRAAQELLVVRLSKVHPVENSMTVSVNASRR